MKAIKAILTALATGVAAVPSIDCLASDSHKHSIVSNYNGDEIRNEKIVSDLHEKIECVNNLTSMASDLYFSLLSMSTDEARKIIAESGANNYENSEMFIRALEIFAKNTAEENTGNVAIYSDIVEYWKSIAKARYEISRLNNFVKQLTVIPKTYESDIDFSALKELAQYATGKVISGKYDLA
ncbi:hypothetical protein GWI67_08165 [Proteus sp. G2672]|uniref:hypothetical protein n=1 Tax=Proteus TaxID=583 RepID=UPI0013765E51|nr:MULTISPECIES: hypothetical protein [Proteus]MCX2589727.1 hypothetical protein [Proteus penneri]NBL77551.1 hypothetical protein [Proteus sp. G2672]NBM59222.1 hypothetical protein [Proteus sp. G2667]